MFQSHQSFFSSDQPTVESQYGGSKLISACDSALYARRQIKLCSRDEILRALDTDAVARRVLAKGLAPAAGDTVGIRVNINVLKSTGVCVHSVHEGTKSGGHTRGKGLYGGTVITYLPVVVLEHAYFNVHQRYREGIASGTLAKLPMASIDGTFVEQSSEPSFDGVELSFNPKRTHLFVDSENYAIAYAEHVTILGHRAFARGHLRYFCAEDAPAKAGSAPSCARFR